MSAIRVLLEQIQKGAEIDRQAAMRKVADVFGIVERESRSSDSEKWCTAGVWPVVVAEGVLDSGTCLAAYDSQSSEGWVVAGPQCSLSDLMILKDSDWLYNEERGLQFFILQV